MAKDINFSIANQGGEIDKYQLTLLDMGNNFVAQKTFTPPFGATIQGSFTGLADNTQYKVDKKAFIGSIVNNCSFDIVSTESPIVYITGEIKGEGDAVVISNLSQSIPCAVDFPVDGKSTSLQHGFGEFSASVHLNAGETSIIWPNADGFNGVVEEITPSVFGGSTFDYIVDCNGTSYIFKLAINGGSVAVIYKYGATAADTTGSPLTEAEYILSVDDVFTAGNEKTGIIGDPASDIIVGSFENGGVDKVLFLEPTTAVDAFTKWSEVGNPFQQNQPIDQFFGSGSNVWFKSTRGGKDIYLTRSQTSFAGAVIFSR